METINIINVRNAQSLSADNLHMDVEIEHPIHGWIPYSVTPQDTDTTIDNAKVMALIGTDFVAYVAPTQAELDAEAEIPIRTERDNTLFTVVDPLVSNPLRWADLTTVKQGEWATYRLGLLDVPQQAGFPHKVVWPTKPS